MTRSQGREPLSDRPASEIRARALALSAGVAVAFFVMAGLVEALLIRVIRPTELELDWVSDVVLSAALGTAMYLWLHLRATRLALMERERAELVIQTQLSMAETMQRRLLPNVPVPGLGFEWAAALTPAWKIGGDLYDFVEAPSDAYLVLLADVSGKGISAAMALALVHSTFRHVARDTHSPAQLAARMSASFYDEWHGTPYVTCIVAHVAMRERSLTYTNAGHPAGILVRAGAERCLSEGGPPLGLLAVAQFQEERVELTDGDICVFVTDGITEAVEDALQPSHALIAATVRESSRSAADVCHAVMARAFQGLGPQGVDGWEDDRTVVVVAVRNDVGESR